MPVMGWAHHAGDVMMGPSYHAFAPLRLPPSLPSLPLIILPPPPLQPMTTPETPLLPPPPLPPVTAPSPVFPSPHNYLIVVLRPQHNLK